MKSILIKSIVFILVVCFFSCKNNIVTSYNHTAKDSNIRFDMRKYEIYQFSMSKQIKTKGIRYVAPVLYETPEEDDPDGVVQEMVYIFKDTTSNQVIYYTTFSHKYLHKKSGVFNDTNYKDYAFINDIDHVYIGRDDGERFSFYDPNGRSFAQNIHFYYSKNEKGDLTIDKVTNSYASLKDLSVKPFVKIEEEVFGMPIRFKKRNHMKLAYKEKKEKDTLKKFSRDGALFLVNELWFYEGELKYSINRNGLRDTLSAGKRRLKFIEPQ